MLNSSEVVPPSVTQSHMMNKYLDYSYRPPGSYYKYYDYLVIIDFEATCDDTRNDNPRPIRNERPEIIQFPAILVNVWTMRIVGIFNSYVRPVEAPVLSEFCTSLTGIHQSDVKKAPTFPEVLRQFEGWLRDYGIALNKQESGCSFAIVTDGSYDMGHFLYKQCIISQVPYPSYATRWVNIRSIFTKSLGRRWGCLKVVLDHIGLPFEGRAHNGLDDSKNICNVLMYLLYTGSIVHQTEKILLQSEDQERNEARILSDKSAGKYDLATVEHICVYSNVLYEYRPDAYDPHEPMPMLTTTTAEYGSSPQQSASSGSCESIASGCSNKENSIPIYIPSKTTAGMRSRAANGSKDATIVGSGSPPGAGSGRQHGKRKKRNLQLKDPSSIGNPTNGSCLKGPGGVCGAKVVVGTDLIASSDVSNHSHLHQSKQLDYDGSSTTHLQPLVSDLPTEE